MFEKYTYKKKFFALLAVFVLLGATAYKRSFGNLVELYIQNGRIREKVEDIKAKSKDFERVRQDKENFDVVFGSQKVSRESVQQNIAAFASGKRSISIHELAPLHSFSTADYLVTTNQLDITGSLDGMVSLAYDFERHFSDSRIRGMYFYETKFQMKETLHLKLIFQNYESTK